MKEKIRKIITEKVHAILEIEEISKNASVKTFRELQRKIDDIKDDSYDVDWFSFPIRNLNLSHNIFVNEMTVTVYVYKNKKEFVQNKVGGSFDENSIRQLTDDSTTKYNIGINIKIYNWDYNTDIQNEIKLVFEHELHHAFSDLIIFNKKSVSNALNSANKSAKAYLKDIIEKHKEIKEFVDVFYLNLSKERNARVHQLHLAAKKFKEQNLSDVIINLENLTPFKDFQRMRNFDDVDLSNIPFDVKKEFVDKFNLFLDYYKQSNNFSSEELNYPKNPEAFFRFWKKQFKKNSDELFKKAIHIARFINHEVVQEGAALYYFPLSNKAMEVLFGLKLNSYEIL